MEGELPSIEASRLTKRYGPVTAVSDVSFSVAKGEVVGFLGPNGAGKSTTLRILCGLTAADAGVARIQGVPVASRPDEARRLIGYMPENNPLPEDLRVIEYLRHRGRLKGVRGRALASRLEEVMERCELHRKPIRRKMIGALSKGFRQRVGIADALLGSPQVVILDEPTIGLDPHQIIAIRKLIDELRGEMTIILSSHILAEVEISCDRVIIINRGRVVTSGAPGSLREEFIQDYTYEVSFKGSEDLLTAAAVAVDGEIRVEASVEEADGFRRALLVSGKTEHLGEALLGSLRQQPGLTVRALHRRESRLEDIFLAATKRSWEETAETLSAKAV